MNSGGDNDAERGSGIDAAARDAVSLARSGASSARLRARLRRLVVPGGGEALALTAANAALLANQIPLWLGGAGAVERTTRAIALFLDRRVPQRPA